MSFKNWKQQYEIERARLIDTPGKITEGGVVEAIEHIGATSVPGLHVSDCVDIGLAIWPFPLEDRPKSRLESIGYQTSEGFPGSLQQGLQHISGSSLD